MKKKILYSQHKNISNYLLWDIGVISFLITLAINRIKHQKQIHPVNNLFLSIV